MVDAIYCRLSGTWRAWRASERVHFESIKSAQFGLVFALCSAGLWTGACSDGERRAALRDRNLRADFAEVVRLGDGAQGDTLLFGTISDIEANSRGDILVADGRAHCIYVFSAHGELMQVVGSRGEGPGEFNFLTGFDIGPGDTVFVFDNNNARVSAFEPLRYALSHSFAPVGDDFGTPFTLVGATSGGPVMAYASVFFTDRSRGVPASEARYATYNLLTYSGEIARTVLRLPAEEQIVSDTPSMLFIMSKPFGRKPVVRLGPDDLIYWGWNDSIDVRVSSLDGEVAGRIRSEHHAVQVSAEEDDRVRSGVPSSTGHKALRDARLPRTKPAYTTSIVDDAGRLWLRSSEAAGDTVQQWSVWSMTGRYFGRALLPRRMTLMSVARERAYVAARERASGAPVVVVYRINWVPEPGADSTRGYSSVFGQRP